MQFVLWNVHRVLCVDLQSLISHIRFKMSCDLADSLLTFEFLVFTKKKTKQKKQWPDFCLKSVTYQHSSPISNEVT